VPVRDDIVDPPLSARKILMKILPYLLLVAAGAVSVPTLIAAFTGDPINGVFVGLSSALLLLALLSLPYRQRSASGTEPLNI
jgi:hypothetical protein